MHCLLLSQISFLFPKNRGFCVACESLWHIGITLSGGCLCVCLSSSYTFLAVTNSFVLQAIHAFLGMLSLFSENRTTVKTEL